MRKVWLAVLMVACTRVPATTLRITGVEPSETIAGSTTPLRITGSDFSPHAFVSYARGDQSTVDSRFLGTLGDEALTAIAFVDSSTLVATAPALPPGTYDLSVEAPDGSSATLPAAFTVHPMMTTSTGASGPSNNGPCAGMSTPECTLVGWAFKRKIRFNQGFQASVGPVTVLVALDNTRIDYGKTTGDDLRFLDSDEVTQLPFEIEKWDPLGRSIVWVRVPQVDTGTTDHIYMVYGNASAPAATGPTSVWTDGYDGVWHLETLKEATGRISTNLLPQGPSGAQAGPTSAAGMVGGGRRFDGIDDSLFIGSGRPLLNGATAVTFSAWVYLDELPPNGQQRQIVAVSVGGTMPTSMSRTSLSIMNSAGVGNIVIGGRTHDMDPPYPDISGGAPLPTGSWHYLTVTQDLANDTTKHYRDGLDINNNPVTFSELAFPNTLPFSASIGSQDNPTDGDSWLGVLDEVRIARSYRTSAWVNTDFRSVNDQLCIYEAEQARP